MPVPSMTWPAIVSSLVQLRYLQFEEKKLPHHLHKSSTFEVLPACLWRCRTIAIQLDSEDEVRLIFAITVRNKFNSPIGYYGNGIAVSLALTTAGKLCQSPLEYALELIKSAKNNVTEEYVRSLIHLLVIKGRPFSYHVHSYVCIRHNTYKS